MTYAIQWTDTVTGATSVCEVEAGVCYYTFPTLADATTAANESNADAERNGWASRYHVITLPEGLAAYVER